jgi:hypothetical protein
MYFGNKIKRNNEIIFKKFIKFLRLKYIRNMKLQKQSIYKKRKQNTARSINNICNEEIFFESIFFLKKR